MTIRVGDTVRRIGPTTDYFTRGSEYVVSSVVGDKLKIGGRFGATSMFELVRSDWLEHVSYQVVWSHVNLGPEIQLTHYASPERFEVEFMRHARNDRQYRILATKKVVIPYKAN